MDPERPLIKVLLMAASGRMRSFLPYLGVFFVAHVKCFSHSLPPHFGSVWLSLYPHKSV